MENFESCFFKYSVDVKEMPLKKCHHPGLAATEAKNLWIIFVFKKLITILVLKVFPFPNKKDNFIALKAETRKPFVVKRSFNFLKKFFGKKLTSFVIENKILLCCILKLFLNLIRLFL